MRSVPRGPLGRTSRTWSGELGSGVPHALRQVRRIDERHRHLLGRGRPAEAARPHRGAVHQAHHHTGGTRTTRSAGAVHVGLGVLGRVDVDHAGQVVHVDASGGHVGGDQRLDPSLVECVERPGPLRLASATVDRLGRHAQLVELAGHPVGPVTGPAEHDRRTGGPDDLRGHPGAVGRLRDHREVRGARSGRLRCRHPHHARRALVLLDERAHWSAERRREQRRLPVAGGEGQQASDRREEPHVRHAVRLVHHDELHGVESQVTPLEQVLDPSRAADHQVHAAAQTLDLRADPDAAEHGGHGRAVTAGERHEDVGDLGGELPGRGQDERGRSTGLPHAAALQQGQAERQGLPGTRRRLGRQVVSGEQLGDARLLDGRGFGEPLCVQAARQVLGQAEFGEGGHGWYSDRPRRCGLHSSVNAGARAAAGPWRTRPDGGLGGADGLRTETTGPEDDRSRPPGHVTGPADRSTWSASPRIPPQPATGAQRVQPGGSAPTTGTGLSTSTVPSRCASTVTGPCGVGTTARAHSRSPSAGATRTAA